MKFGFSCKYDNHHGEVKIVYIRPNKICLKIENYLQKLIEINQDQNDAKVIFISSISQLNIIFDFDSLYLGQSKILS